MLTMEKILGDFIYAYTSAQAINDGVLIDATSTAKEVGLMIVPRQKTVKGKIIRHNKPEQQVNHTESRLRTWRSR